MFLKLFYRNFRLGRRPCAGGNGTGETILRRVIAVSLAFVLSLSFLSGRVLSQSVDESGLDFKDFRAQHPSFVRLELLTGAYQTTPGLTVSHAAYYKAPTFIGFGATISQLDGPALVALFAELRYLPTDRTLAETFAFNLGFWDEVKSAGSASDNGFMFGVSVGFTRRAFGTGHSRLIGEIGYRLIGRPVSNVNVLAPCPIGLLCAPVESQQRNTHNLVLSLGVLF